MGLVSLGCFGLFWFCWLFIDIIWNVYCNSIFSSSLVCLSTNTIKLLLLDCLFRVVWVVYFDNCLLTVSCCLFVCLLGLLLCRHWLCVLVLLSLLALCVGSFGLGCDTCGGFGVGVLTCGFLVVFRFVFRLVGLGVLWVSAWNLFSMCFVDCFLLLLALWCRFWLLLVLICVGWFTTFACVCRAVLLCL